ncbi:DIS3-like exonuclease 2 [Achroia grisella]|uniref:DIS3-like exonuclease 2 n=1 Tax=Achroia grisella TaxID=688607 RepID=UPI0027D2D699|nr:DIS3-like exonuclease 2 [Achroia grisella]
MNMDTGSDLSSRCQNLNISGTNDVNNRSNQASTPSKKKNAKKKERLKPIQMPTPSIEFNSLRGLSNSMQRFFMNEVTPMYANNSTRCLEYAYFPQYMNNTREMSHNVYHPRSVPSTPILQNGQNIMGPSSPLLYASQPATPLVQNVMQHPLLSLSLPNGQQNPSCSQRNNITPNMMKQNSMHFSKVYYKNSPRSTMQQKKKQMTKDDKKFEPHLSVEEVQLGLKNNSFIEGVLRINPKQFQHSYVSSNDRSEQDILIDGIRNRNRALEGDIVVVQLISDSDSEDGADDNKQKKGKVVYIKEKVHTRACIGKLKLMPDKNRQKALFVPRDHRVPRLNIPFTCWPDNFYYDAKNYENTLFLAKIIDWSDTRFAIGKIECNIGQSGNMKTETKAILAQTDLDVTPFGPEVRGLFPSQDYVIPEDEIRKREDCRALCLFSIDPFNCRDIDDAVSCKVLDNGNFEIGVHISDVAHFLTENTILDEKVADKATTIYLVEKAYHMLPDELCMLCSLFPGIDKLAFSVFWEITKDAKVISHRFSKTVIHSCCQLAYDHAQAILDNNVDAKDKFPETYNGFQYSDIQKSIKILGEISSKFRRRRFENGALRIDQSKVAFQLNTANGLPDSFYIYESKESHQLIEEFMLLANMTVAERIYNDHPNLAFLRCHPEPSAFMLKQLAKSLEPLGINLEISSAADLHRSLLPHVGLNCTDKGKAMVLNMLCAKPMTRAKYFCAHGCDNDDLHHYALNVSLYTHFTSPIRRYADIMVHRLLAASLKYREVPTWDVDKVRMIAAQCNKQKYNAKKAGEMSTELYTLKYIELNSPFVTEAAVVDVREKYIDVIIVIMGLNRRIFFNNDFPGQYKCIKNDAGTKLSKMELTWHATANLPEITQVIGVFSILQVELNRDDDMVKVETKLVRPK